MLNGMFICTIGLDGYMTKGKIYEFVDGKFTSDRERQPEIYGSIENFNSRHGVVEIAPYNPTPKDLLTVGRVVEIRSGKMYFVLPDRLISKSGWLCLDEYNDELIDNQFDCMDVVAIYDAPIKCRSAWNLGSETKEELVLVWKRESKSPQQIEKESIQAEMVKLAERLKELEVK